MTVLSSETKLLGGPTTALPRVNLLPPEIAEQRAFRRIQFALGAAVLASVAVVGLLYMSASHSVSSANSDLAAATQQNTSLQSQVAQFHDVTSIYAQAAAAQAQLTTAMGDEVRYSQLLNDLSLSVPSNVWLTSVAFTQGGSSVPAAAAAAAAAAPGAPTQIGTFTVSGVAFSHDDVAVWLESIAGLKTYANPYFSSSTEALIGTRKSVNFGSTAAVTSAALSGRYTKPAGG
ncbi:MAG: PilN domain-containing protein [Mycobacteriales bacterium]